MKPYLRYHCAQQFLGESSNVMQLLPTVPDTKVIRYCRIVGALRHILRYSSWPRKKTQSISSFMANLVRLHFHISVIEPSGRQYGVNGLLDPWWSSTSESNFGVAKKCYEDQYSTLEITAYDTNDTFLVSPGRVESLSTQRHWLVRLVR